MQIPDGPTGVFFILDDSEKDNVEEGFVKNPSASLLTRGWKCQACGQEKMYDPPVRFSKIEGPAMAHDRTCPLIPREC